MGKKICSLSFGMGMGMGMEIYESISYGLSSIP